MQKSMMAAYVEAAVAKTVKFNAGNATTLARVLPELDVTPGRQRTRSTVEKGKRRTVASVHEHSLAEKHSTGFEEAAFGWG